VAWVGVGWGLDGREGGWLAAAAQERARRGTGRRGGAGRSVARLERALGPGARPRAGAAAAPAPLCGLEGRRGAQRILCCVSAPGLEAEIRVAVAGRLAHKRGVAPLRAAGWAGGRAGCRERMQRLIGGARRTPWLAAYRPAAATPTPIVYRRPRPRPRTPSPCRALSCPVRKRDRAGRV
jgi:hypothetical protein